MSTVALKESVKWADELMEAEWRGRKDNESAVRYRLSKNIGVPDSYIFRLQYKWREMSDVKGSVYRALMLARHAYGLACDDIEASADRMRSERLRITRQDYAADQGHPAMARRMARAAKGAEREVR